MGYSTTISQQAASDRWTLNVSVSLSRAETNDLFLAGDSMVSWPTDGLLPSSEGEAMPERSSIFVSEIAAAAFGPSHLLRRSGSSRAGGRTHTSAVRPSRYRPRRSEWTSVAKAQNLDPLKEALAEYLTIPGMQAALLVSDQGLLISRAALDGVDTASIAALAIDTVATVQRFGLQVQAGYLDTMRIEFDKLTVVLAPFAQDVMLALVAKAGSLGSHVRRPCEADALGGRGGQVDLSQTDRRIVAQLPARARWKVDSENAGSRPGDRLHGGR